MCYCGGCSTCLSDQGYTRADMVGDLRSMAGDLAAMADEEYRLWVESMEARFADSDQLDEVA